MQKFSESTDESPLAVLEDSASQGIGRYRWRICALLFFGTTINYMDRQILGMLKPFIEKDLKWSEIDYANIVLYFQLAYAVGQLGAGWLMDLFGVRLGYAISVIAWSAASMAHGAVTSVFGFERARFALGIAEGGNFPAAIKSVAEWFPRKERALATGIFNSGSNMGVLASALMVPWIASHYGWAAAFYLTGALGFVWVFFWVVMYRPPRSHPKLSARELAYIESDRDEPVLDSAVKEGNGVSWIDILSRRSTYAYLIAGLMTSPVWWFYLFWAPGFLNKRFGVDPNKLGLPMIVIYLMADVGSIAGGWISARLLARGWSLNRARKTTMLMFAALVVPVFYAGFTWHAAVATLLIGLAAAAHQGWSANLFTFISDTTTKKAVSSIVGLGGLLSGLTAMGVAKAVGYLLDRTHDYRPILISCSGMYLLALLFMHLLVPRIGQKPLVDNRGFPVV